MFIYATAYILYCLQYFTSDSGLLWIKILYTTSMLCSMTAQYIRVRYTWCLQYLTMTCYAITDKLVFYLELIKIFSWKAKYGYLQWLLFFSICSTNTAVHLIFNWACGWKPAEICLSSPKYSVLCLKIRWNKQLL